MFRSGENQPTGAKTVFFGKTVSQIGIFRVVFLCNYLTNFTDHYVFRRQNSLLRVTTVFQNATVADSRATVILLTVTPRGPFTAIKRLVQHYNLVYKL